MAFFPYLVLLERSLSCSRRSFKVQRVLFLASCGEMVLSGDSGVISRSLVQRSFQIRNAHSDIMIRNRRVAPWRTLPFSSLTFRRGRAVIVVMSRPEGQGMFFLLHRLLAIFHISSLWFASQLNRICCIDSVVSHSVQRLLSLRLAILDQYGPHLWALWRSFHKKILTLVDMSLLFKRVAFHIRSLLGLSFSRSWIVVRVRLRFEDVWRRSFGWFNLEIILYAVAWVRQARRAPDRLCSGEVMNRVFRVLFWVDPSEAKRSASSFPSIPEWPLIHSKEVEPARFFILFMMGFRMFACVMRANPSSSCFALLTQRALIAHSESVLM